MNTVDNCEWPESFSYLEVNKSACQIIMALAAYTRLYEQKQLLKNFLGFLCTNFRRVTLSKDGDASTWATLLIQDTNQVDNAYILNGQ